MIFRLKRCRMTLFGLFFFPAGIMVSDFIETFRNLRKVNPKMKLLGEGTLPISGGFYPWQWVQSEIESFKALQVAVHSFFFLSNKSLAGESFCSANFAEDHTKSRTDHCVKLG